MKLLNKIGSRKKLIKMNKSEWLSIGKNTGWIKNSQNMPNNITEEELEQFKAILLNNPNSILQLIENYNKNVNTASIPRINPSKVLALLSLITGLNMSQIQASPNSSVNNAVEKVKQEQVQNVEKKQLSTDEKRFYGDFREFIRFCTIVRDKINNYILLHATSFDKVPTPNKGSGLDYYHQAMTLIATLKPNDNPVDSVAKMEKLLNKAITTKIEPVSKESLDPVFERIIFLKETCPMFKFQK